MNLDNIRIVLVNTSHPGNIGGVARAMKNMGLSRLYLVAPRQYPDEQADWRAVSAIDVLESAVVTETLEEAIGDCQFVVGTSARNRRIPWPLQDPRQCAGRIAKASAQQQVAVLFGREDRGLTNDELKLCNLHLNIPTSEAYSSLNLAMAVQILTYELLIPHRETTACVTFGDRCDRLQAIFADLIDTAVEKFLARASHFARAGNKNQPLHQVREVECKALGNDAAH